MRPIPGSLIAGLFCLASCLPGHALAQISSAQPSRYLLTTDATDGRAVWLQPAGLARRAEALLGAHVTAGRTGGNTDVSELGLTAASGGLAFGWERSRLGSSAPGSAYALGVGLGDPVFSAGVVRRWMGGGGRTAGTWDLGTRYQPSPELEVSLVWRDIGSPVVRDTIVHAVLVPAAALNLLRGRVRAGAEWDVVTDGWGTTEFRAGGMVVLGSGLTLGARASFSPGFARRSVSVALEWSGLTSRAVLFGERDASPSARRIGASGALVATAPQRQPIGRMR